MGTSGVCQNRYELLEFFGIFFFQILNQNYVLKIFSNFQNAYYEITPSSRLDLRQRVKFIRPKFSLLLHFVDQHNCVREKQIMHEHLKIFGWAKIITTFRLLDDATFSIHPSFGGNYKAF